MGPGNSSLTRVFRSNLEIWRVQICCFWGEGGKVMLMWEKTVKLEG